MDNKLNEQSSGSARNTGTVDDGVGFSYVNIVGEQCKGWLNLFFGDQCIAIVSDVRLADSIRNDIDSRNWVGVDDETPSERTMVIAHCVPLYGDEYITGCWFECGNFYDQGRTVRVKQWARFPKLPNQR